MVKALRTRHYSRRTEEAHLTWIRRFLVFHNGTHPREMAGIDVNRFLTHLAVGAKVAASAQNQALSAVLFLYEHVPASSHYVDGTTGIRYRHYLHKSVIQKAVHDAARRAGLPELMGHKDVQTTMVYTHVLNRGGRGLQSPLGRFRKAFSSDSGRDSPASAVGLKQGGRLLGMVEVTTNKDVVVWAGRRRPRPRPTTRGFIQVSLSIKLVRRARVQ